MAVWFELENRNYIKKSESLFALATFHHLHGQSYFLVKVQVFSLFKVESCKTFIFTDWKLLPYGSVCTCWQGNPSVSQDPIHKS